MQLFQSQMITLARGRFGTPASLVLEHVRAHGLVTRDELAPVVPGSTATLNRTVGALVSAGLLRERPDRARAGVVGRPLVPLEIDPERFVVLGLHLGRRRVTVALGDLTGRVVASRVLPREREDHRGLVRLAVVAAELTGARTAARPLAAGLVAPWRSLDLDPGEVGAGLADVLGLEVATADHVAAVAATEFLHRRAGTDAGVTLYVYARETVGNAIAVDKGFQTEVSRVGDLTHFPTGSDARCSCGHTGCLEATVSDQAVVEQALAEGLLDHLGPCPGGVEAVVAAAGAGGTRARALLVERARVLGRAAAHVSDMVVPDRVVLVGQGYTGYAPAVPHVVEAFRATAARGEVDLQLTRFGAGIQAHAACTVALGPVYDDPLRSAPAVVGARPTPGGLTPA